METLYWIVGGGVLMTAISLSGSITLLLPKKTLGRLVLPLVAFAAGSLLGGAFLHMLPAAHRALPDDLTIYLWVLAGFAVFFALEQLLHWHHCNRAEADCRHPLTYLVLIGDGLHNLLGGIAVAGTFLIDVRLGIAAWIAAAAHEVPQEFGDFGVLLHGGWKPAKALLFNALSGVTFLVGGVAAYVASHALEVTFLVPFAAGNFIYIGASDLVPEINKNRSAATNLLLFASFCLGVVLLWIVRATLEG